MSVSRTVHWTVLNRFVALTCSVTALLPFSRRSRVSVAFSWRPPGPTIVLRAASPTTPGPGGGSAAGVSEHAGGGGGERGRVEEGGNRRRRQLNRKAGVVAAQGAVGALRDVGSGAAESRRERRPRQRRERAGVGPPPEHVRQQAAVCQPASIRAEGQLDGEVRC